MHQLYPEESVITRFYAAAVDDSIDDVHYIPVKLPELRFMIFADRLFRILDASLENEEWLN